MELVKKQIEIPKSLERKFDRITEKTQKGFKEIVREAMTEYADKFSIPKRKKKQRKALLKMIGLISSGITDGSVNHDKELYDR